MTEPLIDPHGTIAMMQRIAGINHPVETMMHCTTTMWAKFVEELNKLPRDVFMDPTKLATPQNCKRFKIQSTVFVNSGTADPRVCDRLNEAEARKSNFREKHDRLAQRVGTKPVDIDAVDPESTHEVPEELMREIHDTPLKERQL